MYQRKFKIITKFIVKIKVSNKKFYISVTKLKSLDYLANVFCDTKKLSEITISAKFL